MKSFLLFLLQNLNNNKFHGKDMGNSIKSKLPVKDFNGTDLQKVNVNLPFPVNPKKFRQTTQLPMNLENEEEMEKYILDTEQKLAKEKVRETCQKKNI